MNFTELQMELRSIEEHISRLHNEIEKMKPQTEEEKKTDFETISRLARKHPVKNAKLTKALPDVKKTFIRGLAYLLVTEETDVYDRLLYLTRLSIGCGLEITAEEIYKSGLEFEAADIERLCTDLTEDDKCVYLVEAFILANLSAEPAVNIWFVIADVAKAMGFDKEELRVTAQVAKAKFIGNLDILKELPVPLKNKWGNRFTDYISHDWIVRQRIESGQICTTQFESPETDDELWKEIQSDRDLMDIYKERPEEFVWECQPCKIISHLKDGSIVKTGDNLCVYTEKVNQLFEEPLYDKKEKTLRAPCNGIVFFIKDKVDSRVAGKKDEYISVYVVSYFDEYNDFCQWYRNGCQ